MTRHTPPPLILLAGTGALLVSLSALLLGSAPASAVPTGVSQELPAGVTPQMVEQGKALFAGDGLCSACHGADGAGIKNLGNDLTDENWIHTDGSYQAIVTRVTEGVSAEASSSGIPMPPRGGARLSADQVRAVSAYVWVISRGGS